MTFWTGDNAWDALVAVHGSPYDAARSSVDSAERTYRAPVDVVIEWRRRLLRYGDNADEMRAIWDETRAWIEQNNLAPFREWFDRAKESVAEVVDPYVPDLPDATPWWVWVGAGVVVLLAVGYAVRSVK